MGRPLGPPADRASTPPSNRAKQMRLPPTHLARFLTLHKILGSQYLLPLREQSARDEEFPGKRRSPEDSLHTTRQSRPRHRSSESRHNSRNERSRRPPAKKAGDCSS